MKSKQQQDCIDFFMEYFKDFDIQSVSMSWSYSFGRNEEHITLKFKPFTCKNKVLMHQIEATLSGVKFKRQGSTISLVSSEIQHLMIGYRRKQIIQEVLEDEEK